MKKLIPIIFIFIFQMVNGQTPQAINYQGIARNSLGHALINQNIGIRLSILDSSNVGQAIYIESHSLNTNSSGLFNLSIGLGTVVSGNFSTIPWGQGNKWLKVEMINGVGNNYQLIGTTQFLSVPFAINAGNGNKPGTSIGDMQYWNGTNWVNVPVGLPGQYLHLNNLSIPSWNGPAYPTLNTIIASDVTGSRAKSGGEITNDGGDSIIARGICFSINRNPTIKDGDFPSGSGIGIFIVNLTNLFASTTYYLRAYAINSAGTAYGNEISFTTSNANIPTISTMELIPASYPSNEFGVHEMSPFTPDVNLNINVTSGGIITDDGGANVSSRGICYSTNINPTTSNNLISGGAGTGNFISNLTGLNTNTTFYLRAYATNIAGTAYGNVVSFTSPTSAFGLYYQGGLIAYILQQGDQGYDPNVKHGLLAAYTSYGIYAHNFGHWDCGGTLVGAEDAAIGAGYQNTINIIMNNCTNIGLTAAQLCNDLVLNGYDDWYLPSKNELNKVFLLDASGLGGINNGQGGFRKGSPYWSSTEVNSSTAIGQYCNFPTYDLIINTKNNQYYICPIRSF